MLSFHSSLNQAYNLGYSCICHIQDDEVGSCYHFTLDDDDPRRRGLVCDFHICNIAVWSFVMLLKLIRHESTDLIPDTIALILHL